METVLVIAGIAVLALIVLGVVGNALNFARGLIRTLFSFAVVAAIVTAILWFMNGQSLPF